jgi:hypothetical protein
LAALLFRVGQIEATLGKVASLAGALGREVRYQRGSLEELQQERLAARLPQGIEQRIERAVERLDEQARTMNNLDLSLLRIDEQLRSAAGRIDELATAGGHPRRIKVLAVALAGALFLMLLLVVLWRPLINALVS